MPPSRAEECQQRSEADDQDEYDRVAAVLCNPVLKTYDVLSISSKPSTWMSAVNTINSRLHAQSAYQGKAVATGRLTVKCAMFIEARG